MALYRVLCNFAPVGSRRELVANSVHTADADISFIEYFVKLFWTGNVNIVRECQQMMFHFKLTYTVNNWKIRKKNLFMFVYLLSVLTCHST